MRGTYKPSELSLNYFCPTSMKRYVSVYVNYIKYLLVLELFIVEAYTVHTRLPQKAFIKLIIHR